MGREGKAEGREGGEATETTHIHTHTPATEHTNRPDRAPTHGGPRTQAPCYPHVPMRSPRSDAGSRSSPPAEGAVGATDGAHTMAWANSRTSVVLRLVGHAQSSASSTSNAPHRMSQDGRVVCAGSPPWPWRPWHAPAVRTSWAVLHGRAFRPECRASLGRCCDRPAMGACPCRLPRIGPSRRLRTTFHHAKFLEPGWRPYDKRSGRTVISTVRVF